MIQSSTSCISSNPTGAANLSHGHASGYNLLPASCFPSASGSPEAKQQDQAHNSSTKVDGLGDPRQEMQVLKEQLEVLRYQVGFISNTKFSFNNSRTAVKSLLPGEALLKASVAIGWRTAPPSGGSAFSQIC